MNEIIFDNLNYENVIKFKLPRNGEGLISCEGSMDYVTYCCVQLMNYREFLLKFQGTRAEIE